MAAAAAAAEEHAGRVPRWCSISPRAARLASAASTRADQRTSLFHLTVTASPSPTVFLTTISHKLPDSFVPHKNIKRFH